MSGTMLKKALDRWVFGERFYFRSPLDEGECKRRIGLYSSGLFVPSVTSDLIAAWKGDRVYVTMQLGRRSPMLVGKLRPLGTGTEIVGRSGGDTTTFWLCIGLAAFFAWKLLTLAPTEPIAWSILLLPFATFFLLRRSPHGEHLIDFLQQLLDAEDVLARSGDPFVRV